MRSIFIYAALAAMLYYLPGLGEIGTAQAELASSAQAEPAKQQLLALNSLHQPVDECAAFARLYPPDDSDNVMFRVDENHVCAGAEISKTALWSAID